MIYGLPLGIYNVWAFYTEVVIISLNGFPNRIWENDSIYPLHVHITSINYEPFLFILANDSLNIKSLKVVKKALEDSKFPESKWIDLGDALGLHPTTLSTIEANHKNDVHRCLRELLVKWLEGADGVSATRTSLVEALEEIGLPDVASKLSRELKCWAETLFFSKTLNNDNTYA